MDPKTIAVPIIDRYLKILDVIEKLEEIGASIQIVDDLLQNEFEPKLVASIMYDPISNDPYHEFFPTELASICDHIHKSSSDFKANAIVSIFGDLISFYKAGLDGEGPLAESDSKGTIYYNNEGESLKLSALYEKYGIEPE